MSNAPNDQPLIKGLDFNPNPCVIVFWRDVKLKSLNLSDLKLTQIIDLFL